MGGGWNALGEGCCENMANINASFKVWDKKPNGSCTDECQNLNSTMAVKFPGDAWCTCLGNDFNVSECVQPLCKVNKCCSSSGVGVWTYECSAALVQSWSWSNTASSWHCAAHSEYFRIA